LAKDAFTMGSSTPRYGDPARSGGTPARSLDRRARPAQSMHRLTPPLRTLPRLYGHRSPDVRGPRGIRVLSPWVANAALRGPRSLGGTGAQPCDCARQSCRGASSLDERRSICL